MSTRDVKRALRRRRRELRAQLAERRARLQKTLAAHPLVQARARRRRRQVLELGLAVALLALLFSRCSCGPGPVDDAAPKVTPTPALVKPPPPAPKLPKPAPRAARPPLTGPDLSAQRRGALELEPQGPPPWLDGFRLQVASRSLRLAECFQGAERPGALRWTCSLTPVSGLVSEQTFEPAGWGDALTGPQRECVSAVLATPPYRLPASAPGATSSTPTRVSLVIEF